MLNRRKDDCFTEDCRKMRLRAITGIVLIVSLFVVVPPVGVSVVVVDFDKEFGDFVAQSSVDWWPMFHHDLHHTGYSTSTAPNTNDISWTYTTGSYAKDPAVADGKVYVGSCDCKLHCLNATTGAKIWSYTTGGYVNSCPAVADGKVYVGSNDHKVYCLPQNDPDGSGTIEPDEVIWSYPTGDNVLSSPAVADGKVYVGSSDHKVYCLDAATGDIIWTYTTGDAVWSSPAVAYGNVYVGSHDNYVYCLPQNDPDGSGTIEPDEVIWSYPTGGDMYSSPAVADGKVYVGMSVGAGDNKVYCLDAATGDFIWSYTRPVTGHFHSSPAVAYGNVYIGDCDGNVYCLPQDDPNGDGVIALGEVIWICPTTYWGIDSSPAVADGKVYVGSLDHKVYCLDAATGDIIWTYTTGYMVDSSPAVADGRVYVGSYDGKVYAFGPYSVTIKAHCKTEGVDVSVSITMDGSPTGQNTPHTFTGLTGTHTFTVPSSDPHGHPFSQWNTGETSTTITVTTGGTYTAYYQEPYDVTIKAHCNTQGVDVSVSITMDGSPTGYSTPHTFTSLTCTRTFTVPSTDPHGHPFKQWSTGQTCRAITVTTGGTYTAYYEEAPPPVGGFGFLLISLGR